MAEKVMGETGESIKARPMIYKAVVQVVLLYGIEIWMVTGSMMMVLGGFHNSIAIWIAGMTERKGDSGGWEWNLVDA